MEQRGVQGEGCHYQLYFAQLPWNDQHQASLRNAPHLAVVRLADQLPRALKVLVVLEQCGVQRRLGAVHVGHHQHLGQAGGGE